MMGIEKAGTSRTGTKLETRYLKKKLYFDTEKARISTSEKDSYIGTKKMVVSREQGCIL